MNTEQAPSGPPSHKKRVSWHKRRTYEISHAGHMGDLHSSQSQSEPPDTDDVTTMSAGVKGHTYNANADELCVGKMIRIRDVPGVAWVMWEEKDMMGVELEGPFGNSDGIYDFHKTRYFKTPRNCAQFCTKDQCDYVFDIQAAPRFRHRSHDLNIGDVVMVNKTIGVGVVKHCSSQLVGCELNAPVGDSDGQHEGIRYFQTSNNCAHFCHPSKVKKIAAEELLKKLNETVERLQEIEQDLKKTTGKKQTS